MKPSRNMTGEKSTPTKNISRRNNSEQSNSVIFKVEACCYGRGVLEAELSESFINNDSCVSCQLEDFFLCNRPRRHKGLAPSILSSDPRTRIRHQRQDLQLQLSAQLRGYREEESYCPPGRPLGVRHCQRRAMRTPFP